MQGIFLANVTEIAFPTARPRRGFTVPATMITGRAFEDCSVLLEVGFAARGALLALPGFTYSRHDHLRYSDAIIMVQMRKAETARSRKVLRRLGLVPAQKD